MLNTPLKPYKHQEEGIQLLLDHEYFGLFQEMGLGKSLQVVHAACKLQEQGKIDVVLVVAPAAVRSVWINPEFGEVKKHAFVPSMVCEFHNPVKVIWTDKDAKLIWFVTNYEFLRSEKHRKELLKFLDGRKVFMVADESSLLKNRTAQQTKACIKLGEKCERRVILNGTPISNNPLDLWSQMQFLSKDILPYANFYSFRATFARVDSRHGFPKILGWQNLDRLQREIAPYVIRREKRDCLDLPEKIFTIREVPLSAETWKVYKEMREEAIVWMDENPSMAAQAGVKVLRLCQIAGGFLGGFQASDDDPEPQVKEIGREKLNVLREYVTSLLADKPELKIIVWGRFRAELERVYTEFADFIPTYLLYGGQSKDDRNHAIERFSKLDDKRPALLAAQVRAGGMGLNLVAADHVVYLSNDFSLMTRLQSEDRCHRPGQRNNVLYLDLIATGPDGQKTVDSLVVSALRKKNDLATFTVGAWKRVLTEDTEEQAA